MDRHLSASGTAPRHADGGLQRWALPLLPVVAWFLEGFSLDAEAARAADQPTEDEIYIKYNFSPSPPCCDKPATNLGGTAARPCTVTAVDSPRLGARRERA